MNIWYRDESNSITNILRPCECLYYAQKHRNQYIRNRLVVSSPFTVHKVSQFHTAETIIHAIHLIITWQTWPQQNMNMREYIYLFCYRMSADPKMSIKMLSPTLIRIGCFYHHWIRINKANMVHVSDCRNSIAFIFLIEYMQLVKTVSRNIRWWKSETWNIDANLLGV